MLEQIGSENLKIEELNYHLLPSKRRKNAIYSDIQDSIFNFWVRQWASVFNKSGSPKKGWEDHFLRQDLVAAVSTKTEIIGCVLFTFYNTKALSSLKSEYFSYINQCSLDFLNERQMEDVMSVEYLTVDHRFSQNSLKLSFGKLLVTMAAYVAEEHCMDGILGMPISTTKVDKMLLNIGAEMVQPNIQKYGYVLNLMAAKTQPSEKGRDNHLRVITDDLWDRRSDYTEMLKYAQKAA